MCLFFFKKKTAYEMRISDWSSDVCSSDLQAAVDRADRDAAPVVRVEAGDRGARAVVRRLLDAVREHEIAAIDKDAHGEREEQRQHERHLDDRGRPFAAHVLQGCGERAGDTRKKDRTCHSANIPAPDEGRVAAVALGFCVFYEKECWQNARKCVSLAEILSQ